VPDTESLSTETFNLRLTPRLRRELEQIARLENNFLAPLVRRFLSEGIARSKRAAKRRERADAE